MAKVGTLSVILRAVTGPFRRGLRRASRAIRKFKSRAIGALKSIGRWALRLGVILAGVGSAILAFSIKQAASFERIQVQLEVLLGTAAKAEAQFKKIREFAAVTPFQIEDVAGMSRILRAMGGDMLDTVEMWKRVGGAAFIANTNVETIASNVGRLRVALQTGLLGRGALFLLRKGILTPDTFNKLKAMPAALKKTNAAWNLVLKDLDRFKAAMEKASQTTLGLFSTIKDNVIQTAAQFGEPLLGPLKNAMRKGIAFMRELRDSGLLEQWAERTKQSFRAMAGIVVPVVVSLGKTAIALANAVNSAWNSMSGGTNTVAGFLVRRIIDVEFAFTHLSDIVALVTNQIRQWLAKFVLRAAQLFAIIELMFTKGDPKDVDRVKKRWGLLAIEKELQKLEKRAGKLRKNLGDKYTSFLEDVEKRNKALAESLNKVFDAVQPKFKDMKKDAMDIAGALGAATVSNAGVPLVERKSVAGFRIERGIVDRSEELQEETAENTRDTADGVDNIAKILDQNSSIMVTV